MAWTLVPQPYFSLRFDACSAESSQHSLETSVDSWILELVCKAVIVVLQLVKAPLRDWKQSKAVGQIPILTLSPEKDKDHHWLLQKGVCEDGHISSRTTSISCRCFCPAGHEIQGVLLQVSDRLLCHTTHNHHCIPRHWLSACRKNMRAPLLKNTVTCLESVQSCCWAGGKDSARSRLLLKGLISTT